MSDELERFARALRADAPRVSAEARERAVAAALASFDRRHREHGQGIGDGARHKERMPRFRGTFSPRRIIMSHILPHPRLALAAGTSLVLAAGAAFVALSPPEPLPLLASVDSVPADPDEPSGTLALPRAKTAATAADSVPSAVGGAVADPGDPAAAERALFPERLQSSVGGPGEPRDLRLAPTSLSVLESATEPASLRAVGAISASRSIARLSVDDEPSFPRGGRDRFAASDPNPVKVAAEDPVSTFSVDVDTASYAFVRASLNRGALPPQDAVRIEELVNYFPYGYEPPASRERPFAVHAALMPAPWNAAALLLRVGSRATGSSAPRRRPPTSCS